MDSRELYRQKLLSIPEAVSLVQSNQIITTASITSAPEGLLSELSNHKDRLEDVTLYSGLHFTPYPFSTEPDMAGHFNLKTFFYTPVDRKNHHEGRVSYIPSNLHLNSTNILKTNNDKVDIFWGTATPPDSRGYMSLSLCLAGEKQLLEAADLVILEINKNLPWTLGDTHIHLHDIDHVVENNIPLFTMNSAPVTELERTIGGYISELIDDGCTLQLGIGGIPNAIADNLMARRDLGVHTEMLTNGMLDLYHAGVITGKRKTMWKGKMICAFAYGSQELYDFIDNNIAVEFHQGKNVNNPEIIAKNHKQISVNTALTIDVVGQICAQSIGPRHYSGTGGQLDFHLGAQNSEGGRGIIALRSTAKNGKISTIVPMFEPGTEVSVAAHQADTIVTEFGVAELRGLTIKERMKALIKIAHPDFRNWIREECERLGIVPKLKIPSNFHVKKAVLKATETGVTPDTIRIGTTVDLSGMNAFVGLPLIRGLSAYFKHINEAGGICGRKIEHLIEGDRSDPEITEKATEKLVEKDKVFCMVGPLGTTCNLAVMDYLLHKKVPVISPHSGISTWSVPTKPGYFPFQVSYKVEGQILAQYVFDELKPKRISVFSVNDQFGNEGSNAFIEELERQGNTEIRRVLHTPDENRPNEWVETLKAQNPDLVLVYSYLKPVADLVMAAHALGFSPDWLGNYVVSGAEFLQIAYPKATHGFRAACYPKGPIGHRGDTLYHKLMLREYGEKHPGIYSAFGFTTAQLMVEGLKRTGENLTREKLIEALNGLKNWTGGLFPHFSYDPDDHRGLKTISIQRALYGKWMREKAELTLRE